MQRIIYTKSYKGKEKGDIALVSNNVAHGFIELGVAEVYSTHFGNIVGKSKKTRAELRAERKAKDMKSPVDKMMRADKEKVGGEDVQKYKTK